MVAILDVRKWSPSHWLIANLTAITFLCVIRYGREIVAAMQLWREKGRLERRRLAEKVEAKQQRELLERIREGRKRRIYQSRTDTELPQVNLSMAGFRTHFN